jgi:dihydroorotate dehydrogenase electron transfer subunit
MPVLESPPSVHAATVLDRREPGPGIVILGLHAPRLVSGARPGQFVMAVPPGGGCAGTALGIYEAEGERISLMLVVVGPRTAELAEQRAGSRLDLLGPLGNGFDLDSLGGDVAIVAGGVGLASLLLLTEQVLRARRRAHLYYGARSAPALVDVELFETRGAEVTLATDDGSLGRHGYVTDALAETTRKHSGIAACGPSPMLRAVGSLAERLGIRAQLSLEEEFACGVGACWGCVVGLRAAPAADGTGDGLRYARVCKEGPVFWAHELSW